MTESDGLGRRIHDLKEWQAVAWRRVADPFLTPFECRELRNHIKESNEDLRRCLKMMAERYRFQPRAAQETVDSLAQIKFRLLA